MRAQGFLHGTDSCQEIFGGMKSPDDLVGLVTEGTANLMTRVCHAHAARQISKPSPYLQPESLFPRVPINTMLCVYLGRPELSPSLR